MAGPADILREIHRLRRHAKEVKEEIVRVPRMLQGHQTKVARQEEAIKEAQEAIKKLKVLALEKEGQLKQNHLQIAKYEKQRNEAAGKKEYDALGAEIESAKRGCQKLEDDILATINETEEKTGKVPDLEKLLQVARQELASFDQLSKQRQVDLQGELVKAHAQLKEAETRLPEDLRQQYDRQVNSRGEDAMSAVQGRTCVACYTEITAQNMNELRQGRFLFCKSCGRMLYLAE